MKISTIKNYSSLSILKHEKISFSGVNIGDYTREALSAPRNSNTAQPNDRFEKGLKEIREEANKKRALITSLFKKKKLANIQKEEDSKITGFLKAQEIFIDEQDKVIEMLEREAELARKLNASQDEIAIRDKALLQARKIKEKITIIANNKNRQKGFDSIAGYEAEKFILTDNFINLLPLEMAGENVEFPNSILFFGPIGNGKTSFAKAFAYSANCLFDEVKPKRTERNKNSYEKSFFEDLENKAKEAQKNFLNKGVRTIILIDEIDRFAYDDSSILPKLKKFLQNCSEKYHVTIFATTNNPLSINSAIRGPERMPIKVSIDPPNEINAAEVFKYYLSSLPNSSLSDDINYEKLAQELCSVLPEKAYNNSQIESICNECYEETEDKITQEKLIYYIKRETPGINKESLEKFNKEKDELIGKGEDI